MNSIKITAVISFCSNDWRFLRECVEKVSLITSSILVTVCDHFFDGSVENYALLREAFFLFPNCQFLIFQFDPSKTYRPFSPIFPEHSNWRHEWHNTGRWLSFFYRPLETTHLLFIDCDEIIDVPLWKSWALMEDFSHTSAWRFSGRWHFRAACFEAEETNELSLLVNVQALDPNLLWDEDERMGVITKIAGEKKRQVKDFQGNPMIHHYGGVRPKEEFRRKCRTWGHFWEKEWDILIEKEFSSDFQGKDFFRGYNYHRVVPSFDPLSEQVPSLPQISYETFLTQLPGFPHVTMVKKKEVFIRSIEYEFFAKNRGHHQFLYQ